jgi:hypothetical protein
MMLSKISGAAAVLALGALLFSGEAKAIPCSAGSLTPSTACQNGANGDNNDSAADLNAGSGFFNLTGWVFLEKNNTPGATDPGAFNLGLVVTPDANVDDGTWSFTNSPWGTYGDIAIVLKDGNQNGIFYSAYLLVDFSTSGTWDTGGPGLSHMSVYGRGTPTTQVPEPVSLALLGSGLLALALLRRCKKA